VRLTGRTIVVGVSGGIAGYKACELVRLLVQDGAVVRVVMTANAQQFVTPLTLQTLSGRPVATDTFSLTQESEIGHIRLADEADAIVVAPATANLLAKMAHGIADDLLTTVLLATRAPIVAAPAMNVHMWEHAATRANVATLTARGVHVIGPASGSLACGWEGAGRLVDPGEIVEAVHGVLSPQDLRGERVVVSAGPTREALDPVRYLSNHSSGKMGCAVARVAARRGAEVVLVHGPLSVTPPSGVRRVAVSSALEMQQALAREFATATTLIMCAAVSDFRPKQTAERKLKRRTAALHAIAVVQNPDIVRGLARRKRGQIVIGFAAETHDTEREARRKLRDKGLDLVVANDVTAPGAGFAADTNAVRLIDRFGLDEQLPVLPKDEVAGHILDWVAAQRTRARRRR
jgi:phosphopantothenoylcysteine decarboxylase/phosphopantothenate--cysteine ligase